MKAEWQRKSLGIKQIEKRQLVGRTIAILQEKKFYLSWTWRHDHSNNFTHCSSVASFYPWCSPMCSSKAGTSSTWTYAHVAKTLASVSLLSYSFQLTSSVLFAIPSFFSVSSPGLWTSPSEKVQTPKIDHCRKGAVAVRLLSFWRELQPRSGAQR